MNTQAENIFTQALDLASEARPAFLDQACANDPVLRHEVERLLADAARADSFFAHTLVHGAEEGPGATFTEREGETVGPYKLLQHIGEGGFGVVWMAEQSKPISRMVALKVIKAGMDTKQVLARFEAERQAVAMMDHPNIAKVLDAGATATGRPYFAMELVKGIPITEFCDQAGLGTTERLALFGDVCSAINHAHQKGIIHRDIKPSNVMVTLHGDKAVVKVIDFGIAKATQGKLTDQTLFTKFEQMIGTPVYMSPEQASLSGLDIDTRSDIYALGVLLYELLVGKPPFDSKSLVSAGYEEMRRIIREVEPMKPSSRLSTVVGAERTTLAKTHRIDEARLNRLVEPDLDWIVMKAIEKDRTRRYETANAFAQDIRRFLSDEPVSATPPGARYRFRKFARRNKAALRVAAAIAAVLVAATVVSTWQAIRATTAEKKTAETLMEVAAERDAKEEARKDAEDISTFLGKVFQSPDPARDGRTIKVVELLDKAASDMETDLAGQPAQRAQLQSVLGGTYDGLGLYRQAIPLLEKARAYYLAAFGPKHPDSLQAMNTLSISYHSAGRTDEAFKLAKELLTLSREVYGPEHPDTILAMHNLATFDDPSVLPVEAIKRSEEVLALCLKGYGPEHPATFTALGNLAASYFATGHRDKALPLRERVLAFKKKEHGPEHPETIGAMINLAASYEDAGRHEEAAKLLEEGLALSRRVNGADHRTTLIILNNLALFYEDSHRIEEALAVREELLPQKREALGLEHPDTLSAMASLASSYSDAERKEEALRLREELMPLSRKVLGPEHPETLSAMTNLASSLGNVGRLDEAIALLEQSLAIKRRVLPPEHRYLAVALGGLANLYEKAGRREEAITLGEEAQALSRKVNGPEHPDTLEVMQSLAESYHNAGRRDEALKLKEEVLPLCRSVLGPESIETLGAMTNLAISLGAADRLDEATALLEQSLAIKRRVLPPEHPYLMVALERMGELYGKAGRKDEALKLREEALRLRRKVNGPEHPDNFWVMGQLAMSYAKGDRMDEALKLREEVLRLRRKVNGPEHPDNRWAMGQLADSYLTAGRTAEALPLLAESSTLKPDDTILALKIATLQVWLGQDAQYAATCQRMLEWAANTDNAEVADRVAKVASLCPTDDAVAREGALTLARRAVELGKNDPALPWYQMDLGMAEYRSGHYPAADEALAAAARMASSVPGETTSARIEGNTGFYRAMCLFHQGRPADARALFTATEATIKPLPDDELNPLADDRFDQDDLVLWLAYKEAGALMRAPLLKGPRAVAAVLVPPDAEWRWRHPVDGVDPAAAEADFHTTFFAPAYDDASWRIGRDGEGPTGGFGYGDPAGVEIGTPAEKALGKSAYFRHRFSTDGAHANLELRCLRDDGIIVYLDGAEVVRDNMRDGEEAYGLAAASAIAGASESASCRLPLPGTLPPGEHVLAISLHNTAAPSSDLHLGGITLVEVETGGGSAPQPGEPAPGHRE